MVSSLFLFTRWRIAGLAILGSVVLYPAVFAQSPVVGTQVEATEQTEADDGNAADDSTVRFSFDGVAWREVINWIAEEGNLALHVDALPTGSFTYSDPSAFTHQEAISRINLFLLSEGFTLVRSGQLLSVINLADARSLKQLDTLAKFVTLDQLAALPSHDVVKCLIPLGEIDAEEAVQELSALPLMSPPAVLSKTNQLMITDTVANLTSVQGILNAFEPVAMDNGTIVKSFALQHVDAEDVLVVARPHLGLAVGEMIGIDVSLSADLKGENIFVTGVEDKVKLIEGIVAAIDVPQQSKMSVAGDMELRAYLVEGGNIQTVYDVLQTLLAEQSVRLSMDQTANSLVALATPQVHEQIAATVTELQASEADFEVIPLKSVDPYFAVSLLEEMLDLPGPLDEPREGDQDVPKIDADPGNMRLFVRGKRPQIEQIKKIIAGLEAGGVPGGVEENEVFRVLPIHGEQAVRLLQTAAKFWRQPNSIVLYPSVVMTEATATERVPAADAGAEDLVSPQPATVQQQAPQALTVVGSDSAAEIHCQVTARGLLLQSEDTAALDQLEQTLRAISGPFDATPSPPVVFYLQYTKPDDAVRMLGELLDGEEAASGPEGGSLVNGYVSSGDSGSLFGSLVTSREGTTTMMYGAITVVADSRLNRLIAQGTSADIDKIEGYLKIIDKDRSIASIETYGTSHIIELVNTRAAEVADAIREAYPGRIAGGNQGGQQGNSNQKGDPRQAQREAAEAAARQQQADENGKQGDGKQPVQKGLAVQPSKSTEPMIVVAVHEASNSLIVTAPPQLFTEVEKLALMLDSRGERSIEVVTPLNPSVFGAVQQAFVGTASANSPSAPTARPSNSDRPAARPPVRPKNER